MGYFKGSVEIDNGLMDYACFGTGKRKFIILPGLSLTSVVEKGENVEALYSGYLEDFTFYLFDVRKEIKEDISIRELAEDVFQAAEMLGIKRAVVYGASQGGMIGQNLAVYHPEIASCLILASSVSRISGKSMERLKKWKALTEEGNVRSFNREFAEMVYCEETRKNFEDVFKAMESEGTKEQLEKTGHQIEAVMKHDVYDILDRIKCPVCVMGSMGDKALDVDSMIEMAEKLGCESYFYDGYGHAVYDEAPDFTDRLFAFALENDGEVI